MKKKITIEWDEANAEVKVEPGGIEEGRPTIAEIFGIIEEMKMYLWQTKKFVKPKKKEDTK